MAFKKTIGAMALTTMFVAVSASAVEKNITVTASVDPAIDLLQADGNALPSAVKLAYSPASKTFESYRVMTQVHTNDATKKVIVKLADTPQLTDVLNSTVQMPISVSWGGQVLSTTAKEFEAAALGYSASGVNGVSSSQELVISAAPKTAGTAPTAGNYSGVVSLVMTLGSGPGPYVNKVKFYVLFTALLSSLCAHGAPQSITELCSEYRNTQIYTINDKILSYTESMAGKREMVIITFKSGATFQVEVPGSQHIDSQKKAIERMKDTLRIAYLTETKIDKLCVWNNKTPNSIAAISMENSEKDEL
nr:CFaB/LTB fusion protein [synthetic construct]